MAIKLIILYLLLSFAVGTLSGKKRKTDEDDSTCGYESKKETVSKKKVDDSKKKIFKVREFFDEIKNEIREMEEEEKAKKFAEKMKYEAKVKESSAAKTGKKLNGKLNPESKTATLYTSDKSDAEQGNSQAYYGKAHAEAEREKFRNDSLSVSENYFDFEKAESDLSEGEDYSDFDSEDLNINLRNMIIAKEILDRPLSLRRN